MLPEHCDDFFTAFAGPISLVDRDPHARHLLRGRPGRFGNLEFKVLRGVFGQRGGQYLRRLGAGFRGCPVIGSELQLYGINSIRLMAAVVLHGEAAREAGLLPAVVRVGKHCPAPGFQEPDQALRTGMGLLPEAIAQQGNRLSVLRPAVNSDARRPLPMQVDQDALVKLLLHLTAGLHQGLVVSVVHQPGIGIFVSQIRGTVRIDIPPAEPRPDQPGLLAEPLLDRPGGLPEEFLRPGVAGRHKVPRGLRLPLPFADIFHQGNAIIPAMRSRQHDRQFAFLDNDQCSGFFRADGHHGNKPQDGKQHPQDKAGRHGRVGTAPGP